MCSTRMQHRTRIDSRKPLLVASVIQAAGAGEQKQKIGRALRSKITIQTREHTRQLQQSYGTAATLIHTRSEVLQ